MLDINFIRENLDSIKKNISNRRMNVDLTRLIELDDFRRESIIQIEKLRNVRNSGSKTKPSEDEISKMREIGGQIKALELKLDEIYPEYIEILTSVPNITHPDAPVGEEKDFAVLEKKGNIPTFVFDAKTHDVLMQDLDLIDFERGAKVAGSKYYYSKGDLVRLNQALLNYAIDITTKHGYLLIETPDVAKHDILAGVGFNPRGKETQIYSIEITDLGLIGTAEITVGGYHKDEILDLGDGPKKYVALSHCFRTEAGAYGSANKGLYRVHQFTKLEMFVYCKPNDSEELHNEILEIEKEICDGLELAYRVIDTPTADLGAPAYRKYDIEAFMVMKNEDGDGYGEITSTSNCTDYQARSLNIKYKDENGNKSYVHTLNGTAVVMSRFPLAIFEQKQLDDGSIEIPKALVPYFGKDKIVKNG